MMERAQSRRRFRAPRSEVAVHRSGLTVLLAFCLLFISACSSPPKPEPVTSPIPLRLSAATPIPSPTNSPIPEVAILDIRGKTLGTTKAVIAHAPPGETCTLEYTPPAGPTPPAESFTPTVADARTARRNLH